MMYPMQSLSEVVDYISARTNRAPKDPVPGFYECISCGCALIYFGK
jgi:hypothetical protein